MTDAGTTMKFAKGFHLIDSLILHRILRNRYKLNNFHRNIGSIDQINFNLRESVCQ